MPRIKILASRPQLKKNFEDHPEFDVEIMEGSIELGQVFEFRETRHRIRYRVLEVLPKSGFVTIKVEQPIPWEEYHIGEIVTF